VRHDGFQRDVYERVGFAVHSRAWVHLNSLRPDGADKPHALQICVATAGLLVLGSRAGALIPVEVAKPGAARVAQALSNALWHSPRLRRVPVMRPFMCSRTLSSCLAPPSVAFQSSWDCACHCTKHGRALVNIPNSQIPPERQKKPS